VIHRLELSIGFAISHRAGELAGRSTQARQAARVHDTKRNNYMVVGKSVTDVRVGDRQRAGDSLNLA